jgi:hypothetical protein
MMTGFLASQGFQVDQNRVGLALKRVSCFKTEYSSSADQPYSSYFGEKLHIDQNENLVLYGVTHVCAVDGFSGKIVGFVSMAVKNNQIIYEKLYRWLVW